MNLYDVDATELDEEELTSLLGRIEIHRHKLNQLEIDVMGELQDA